MKKFHYVWMLLLAGFLVAGANPAAVRAANDHPAPSVDGKVWMSSTDAEKRAFLFGAGSAVVLEYHVREKQKQEPSKWVKGWTDGLKSMSWTDMAHKVDAYYKANPDKTERHVFQVIWHEIVAPNLKK